MRRLLPVLLLSLAKQGMADPRLESANFADWRYMQRSFPGQLQLDIAQLRFDFVRKLNDNLSSIWRMEPSLAASDIPTRSDNPQGQWHAGSGDTNLLAGLLHAPLPGFRVGLGVHGILPTASSDNLGYGRYLLGPGAALEADLPDGKGYLQLTCRDLDDTGNGEANRRRQHITQNTATLRVYLTPDWYAEYVPMYRRDQISNKDFVANGVAIGLRLNRQLQLSAGYSWATQTEYMVFERQSDARLVYRW